MLESDAFEMVYLNIGDFTMILRAFQKQLLVLSVSTSLFAGALFSATQSQANTIQENSHIISLGNRPTPVEEVQLTFSMVKPLAVQEGHTGDILAKIEKAGFRIIALRMRTLSQDEAKRFYAEHASKPFFKDLVQKMTSGPVVTMVLQKPDAVASMRDLVGSTDPKKATQGTIRYEFGRSTTDNAIHASDGPASAEREITFFFSQEELNQ